MAWLSATEGQIKTKYSKELKKHPDKVQEAGCEDLLYHGRTLKPLLRKFWGSYNGVPAQLYGTVDGPTSASMIHPRHLQYVPKP